MALFLAIVLATHFKDPENTSLAIDILTCQQPDDLF